MSGIRRGSADLETQVSRSRTVALVTGDDSVRLAAARAFDAAPANWGLRFFEEPPAQADHLVYGHDCPTHLEPRFDPKDPATLLPSHRAVPTGASVGVLSAVGGAGVTTIAAHLAAALSHSNRTLLIEPPGTGALSIRLGVPDEAAVWEPGEPVDVSVPVAGGSSLLRAAELGSALIAADEAGRTAVADLGLVSDQVVACLEEGLVRAVVVVVPPSRPAARLTRVLLHHLGDLDRIVVTNRTGHGGDMTTDKVSAVIGAPIGLELPCTPSLRAAADSGLLVQQPWNRWWRSVRRLAETLEATWTR